MFRLALLSVACGLVFTVVGTSTARAGNPIAKGWYADPDGVILAGKYWIFPTFSARYEDQLHVDAFSSDDLMTWTKHDKVLRSVDVKWATKAMWAPCVVERDGKFYLFFAANDVHPGQVGGIGVAVGDKPEGPYKDLLGRPLINENVNGAQPIDQAVFKDPKSGHWFIVYGGWGHCNIARLKDDFTGLVTAADGTVMKEITPRGYTEGPMFFFRDGKTYFMWSEGGWGDASYRVAYAMADSIDGPFERVGTVIRPDPALATSAGHHSVLKVPGKDEYYIVYHRRPAGETAANHRETCVDRMTFNADGTIAPVIMTREGPPARPLPKD